MATDLGGTAERRGGIEYKLFKLSKLSISNEVVGGA
jgi:hypothetical protein